MMLPVFSILDFPMAALLLSAEPRWPGRLLAWGYLPLGLIAVLLTASRGGFVAAVVALAGCGVLLMRRAKHGVLLAALGLPVLAASAWFAIPHATIERLGTLYEQLQGGNLNQRANIWIAGWHAFVQAPWLGTGAGTFVEAAGLAPADTAPQYRAIDPGRRRNRRIASRHGGLCVCRVRNSQNQRSFADGDDHGRC